MPRGLFELTVMYFRLCNSPGTFMRMMSTIFQDMIHDQKCAIYMDNIIFCGKDRDELHRHTIEGLKILEEHELYVDELAAHSACKTRKNELYRGHRLS